MKSNAVSSLEAAQLSFTGEIGGTGMEKKTAEDAGMLKCGGLETGNEKSDDKVQARWECRTNVRTRRVNGE